METPSTKLGRAIEAVQLAGPRLALLKATVLLALITLRVQNQGLVGERYSTHLIPTFFFKKEVLNGGGRAYIKKNRLGTWQGLKAAEGQPTSSVNLTHSGRMFRSLAASPYAAEGAVFYARIVAADREGARKVEYNLQRYGNWLLPTASEEAEANAAVVAEIQRILKQVFQA
jgi:hypothetical protein